MALLVAGVTACALEPGHLPEEEEAPLSDMSELIGAAPADLREEGSDDSSYPVQFLDLLLDQSPVKSQGNRGTCAYFASTALVESLYRRDGQKDVDLSEQYLVWSAKVQVGANPNTAGGYPVDSLRAVTDYGIVDEDIWPYESLGWSAADNEDCAGDSDLPTHCYTNGDPPEAAVDAPKHKIASQRWLRTSRTTIKEHLLATMSGAVVSLPVFQQAWNYRTSTLPVSLESWREGLITYPNQTDREVSAPKGHAMLIVGWDSELEVPRRDEHGDVLRDDQGRVVTDKGFWLVKNSWGTRDFGRDNSEAAGYGWLSMHYVHDFGEVVVAEALPPRWLESAAPTRQ